MFIKLKGVLETTRFVKSLLGSIIIYLLSNSVEYSIAGFIFLLFSYIFNDIVDYKEDKLAHPSRPLPKGIINLTECKIIAIIIAILGLGVAYLSEFFTFFIILYLSSILYSYIFKKIIPSIGTLFWVILVVLLLLYPLNVSFIEYSLVFSFFYARELLLDYRDKKTDDKFCKSKSLPTILKNYFFILILILLINSVISSIILKNHILIFGSTSAFFIYLYFYYKNIHIKKLNELSFLLLLHFLFILFL